MPVMVPTLGRLDQEDHEAYLGYRVGSVSRNKQERWLTCMRT